MAQYIADLTADHPRQTPSSWTPRWELPSDGAAYLYGDGAAFDQDAIDLGGSTAQRALLSYDDVDAADDVEILTLFRSSDTNGNQFRSYARAKTDGDGNENGYYAELFDGSNLRIRKYDGSGDITAIDAAAFGWSADTDYWVRFRANGEDFKARGWERGTDEPDSWTEEVTDSEYSSGDWNGIGYYAESTSKLFSWVSFGTAGDTAPTPQDVSGTVTLDGVTQDGAEVFALNQDRGWKPEAATTDANGNYTVRGAGMPGDRVYVALRTEDGGNNYGSLEATDL